MGWLISIAVALLTGLAAGAGAFWLGFCCVRWYRITSFEGAAGYAVMAFAIVGAFAGVLVGLTTARMVALLGAGEPGFGRQLLGALSVAAGLLALVALIARMQADVPPTLGGRRLNLLVEFRFPPDQISRPEVTDQEAAFTLGSMERFRRRTRATRVGQVFPDQLRREDGRWVLPARVPLFTGRGKRLVFVTTSGRSEGFLVPLPSRPGRQHTTWSDWLPRPRHDGGQAQNRLVYRFRVEPEPE